MQTAMKFGIFLLAAMCLGTSVRAADEAGNGRDEAMRRNDSALAEQIQKDLLADPLFRGATVQVDLYNGLAIIHGAVPNRAMLTAINDTVRFRRGVSSVYNYMNYPGKNTGGAIDSIAVTFDTFDRLDEVGPRYSAFTISERVEDRLSASPALAVAELEVDAYMGLIILHGTVSDSSLAQQAKEIAAHTPGVDAVLSYINVSLPVSALIAAPVDSVPVLVRPPLEPIPATFETRERVIRTYRTNCGSCD